MKFVNELRKKLKVEEDISEDPLHSQYDVLLTRAEELGSLDGESYSDCKNLIHILQKKVSDEEKLLFRTAETLQSVCEIPLCFFSLESYYSMQYNMYQ